MSNRREIIQIVSEAAPTSAALGDEWVQPSTNRLYKRAVINSKPSWIEITTSDTLQTALNGKQKTITVGTVAPISPSVGDLWVDTN